MRVPIQFIDHNGVQTTDYLKGWPVVPVLIQVGFKPPNKPDETIVPKFQRLFGLVDTGSDHTVIDPSLAVGLQPKRTTQATNVGIVRGAEVYDALLAIEGFKPWSLEIGAASLQGATTKMLVGRDVISKYRLVFDGPRNEFYLEDLPVASSAT